MQGKIKWFSEKRGFGFIESEGKDFFVHKSAIQKNLKLEKGDKVVFEVQESPKGAKAVKVRKIPDLSEKEAHRGVNQPLSQEK